MNCGRARRARVRGLEALLTVAGAAVVLFLAQNRVLPQPVDCAVLAARIAALGEPGQKPGRNYSGAIEKTRADLDRTIRQAHALNCERPHFLFFDPPPPQC